MNKKHKRNITKPITKEELDNTLDTIENTILSLNPKQQQLLAEWFEVWSKYMIYEKTFSPEKLKYYKRGEIVLADFGYNVGSELGGVHYAIIVENDNNKGSNTVVVVPVSSLEDDKSEKDLHNSEVFLGNILPHTNKMSYAKPIQIRAVSKLRIIKPKRNHDGIFKISKEQLTQIDNKIKELFTKQD